MRLLLCLEIVFFTFQNRDLNFEEKCLDKLFVFENPESIIKLNLTCEEEYEVLQFGSSFILRNGYRTLSLSSCWGFRFKKKNPLLCKESIIIAAIHSSLYV
jgi:hypothetical protein